MPPAPEALRLNLPARPDEPEVREYYESQLAEDGDDGYESTAYASTVGAPRAADPFAEDPDRFLARGGPRILRRASPDGVSRGVSVSVSVPVSDSDHPAGTDRAPRGRANASPPEVPDAPADGVRPDRRLRGGDPRSRGGDASPPRDPFSGASAPASAPGPPGPPPPPPHAPPSPAPSSAPPTPAPSQRELAIDTDAARRRARRARGAAGGDGGGGPRRRAFFADDRDPEETPRERRRTGADASRTGASLDGATGSPRGARGGESEPRGAARSRSARGGARSRRRDRGGGSIGRERAWGVSPDASRSPSPDASRAFGDDAFAFETADERNRRREDRRGRAAAGASADSAVGLGVRAPAGSGSDSGGPSRGTELATEELATELVVRDSDAASDSSGVSGASSSRAAALEATRLENLRALGLALTAEEAAGHYRRAARRARQALVERGGPALDRGGPARLRHPRALWNGDRPGLCRLTRPPNRDAAAEGSAGSTVSVSACFLSRSHTEGSFAATAFAEPPPPEVLCVACGDVAFDPVRHADEETPGEGSGVSGGGIGAAFSRGSRGGSRGGEKKTGVVSDEKLFCRECLCVARGDAVGDAARPDAETVARVRSLRVVCPNALTCRRAGGGSGDGSPEGLLWKMDRAGCHRVLRLGDVARHALECRFAVETCGLPRGLNPGDACKHRARRGEMREHMAGCAHRLVACPHAPRCRRLTQSRHVSVHARLCEKRPFACPNRPRCAWTGARDAADAHLSECAHETIRCGFVDEEDADPATCACAARLVRRAMPEHRRVCRYQKRRCEWCGAKKSLRRLSEHEDACDQRFATCRECGRENIPRGRFATHVKDVCPAVEVPCAFAPFGCDARVPRGAYEAHARDGFGDHARAALLDGPAGFRALATKNELARADQNLMGTRILPAMVEARDADEAARVVAAREGEDRRRDSVARLRAEMNAAKLAVREKNARAEKILDEALEDVTRRTARAYGWSADARRACEDQRRTLGGTLVGTLGGVLANGSGRTKDGRDRGDPDDERRDDEKMRRGSDENAPPAGAETPARLPGDAASSPSSHASHASHAAALASTGALDAASERFVRFFAAARDARDVALRRVGRRALALTAAAAPALETRSAMDATTDARRAELAEAIDDLEWRAADRAVVAWERVGDAREALRRRFAPRFGFAARLERKTRALEDARFVDPREDARIRAETMRDEGYERRVRERGRTTEPTGIEAALEGDGGGEA